MVLVILKDIRYEPETGNSEVNKEKRRNFVLSLLEYQSLEYPILFMDETNLNIHISRKKGRSKKAQEQMLLVQVLLVPTSTVLDA